MRVLFLVLLALALATPAVAEPRQHGNVIFDLPASWSLGNRERSVQVVLFHDDRCGFCYLYLGPSAPAEGTLEDFLARDGLTLLNPSSRSGAQIVQPAGLDPTASRPTAVMGVAANGGLLAAMALQVGDRFQLLGFQGGAYDQAEAARSLAFYQRDVAPVVDAFRYVSEGAAPLLPRAQPGSLSGLWWGWTMAPTFGLDGQVHTEMDYRTLVFWPDGHFYDGTPPSGLGELDATALTDSADPDWGTYREDGPTLSLSFADGRLETLAATSDGLSDGLSDGSRTLARVEPLPDGTSLDGTVSTFFHSGFVPGSGLEGGFSSSTSISLFPDGHYESEGGQAAFGNFADLDGNVTGSFAAASSATPPGGSYEVRDGTVILHPADGSPDERQLAFSTGAEVMIGEAALEPR
ncbi:hypothetical protein Rumeso_00856 [Rubellimicrobium mesophilum DSM 19309]|uniref:Thioredoxin domain-containing protein n=1 Tax=Rubellimicrobium mesophilum DSM 19309 TaxID=442562 RepID=A0A017HTN2_9RHOB|nr:hypothetical protein [Rubellimicrobium mesophilum]EYD77690.1 hypothetical protein Rumeso_00856 [Rubellimicrobium mesophilum DSM 19309]